MARIVYFYRHMTEFIRIDLDLLRERHEVTAVECPSRWPRPVLLLRLILRADLVAAWFASWHSFVPAALCRLLGRPCVVSVGGYDTACEPDIGYGHQRGGLRRRVARAAMRLATRLVVVSEASRREVLGLGIPPEKLALCSLGLDPARYPVSNVPWEDLVVTIGAVDRGNLSRKGLEAFVRTAALCPNLTFVVVGAWADDSIHTLHRIAGPNVRFTGRVSHDEKVALLSRARVVVQASRHEAFGLSVAEGMLCGAVPVVTRAGSLPEVTGETAVLVDSQEPVAIAEGVRRAMVLGPEAGTRARERALERFGLARRRPRIVRVARRRTPGPAVATRRCFYRRQPKGVWPGLRTRAEAHGRRPRDRTNPGAEPGGRSLAPPRGREAGSPGFPGWLLYRTRNAWFRIRRRRLAACSGAALRALSHAGKALYPGKE